MCARAPFRNGGPPMPPLSFRCPLRAALPEGLFVPPVESLRYAETEVRAMKLEVVNAFLAAARHSLSQELQSEIKRIGLFVDPSENAIDEVVVYLSFVGQVRGTVLLGLTLPPPRKIASAMVREPLTELTEMGLSALAELGNLMAGGTCIELEQLGFSAVISPAHHDEIGGRGPASRPWGSAESCCPWRPGTADCNLHVRGRRGGLIARSEGVCSRMTLVRDPWFRSNRFRRTTRSSWRSRRCGDRGPRSCPWCGRTAPSTGSSRRATWCA